MGDEGEEADSDSDTESVDKEKKLEEGKLEVDELAKKLKALEKQMVHGGKDIVDSVNENELKLEQHRAEISERKVSHNISFCYVEGVLEVVFFVIVCCVFPKNSLEVKNSCQVGKITLKKIILSSLEQL